MNFFRQHALLYLLLNIRQKILQKTIKPVVIHFPLLYFLREGFQTEIFIVKEDKKEIDFCFVQTSILEFNFESYKNYLVKLQALCWLASLSVLQADKQAVSKKRQTADPIMPNSILFYFKVKKHPKIKMSTLFMKRLQ